MTRELDALHRSAEHLHGVVDGLGPEEVRASAYPTEWTIADVLSHLGSGAVIMRRHFEDNVDGLETEAGFDQGVWDDWNARDPFEQATSALVADADLLFRLDHLDETRREAFRFRMGPFELDFDGFVALRLNEHVLHTWDVAVALDPAAQLPDDATEVLVDKLGMMVPLIGKPIGREHLVKVQTSDPVRAFTVALGSDALVLTPTGPIAEPDLELASEAFIRLVYGRLDPDHTPPMAKDGSLDELRQAFPGF
jgi:uncharacterized protein (TIGR03083 family)